MEQLTGVSVEEAYRELMDGQGSYLLDVRESHELAVLRVPFAIHHPLSVLIKEELGPVGSWSPSTRVFVLCRSGKRSALACEMLMDRGYPNMINVEGGILAWQAHNLPVEPIQASSP